MLITSPVVTVGTGDAQNWTLYCPSTYSYFGSGVGATNLGIGTGRNPGGWTDSTFVSGIYDELSSEANPGKMVTLFKNWSLLSTGTFQVFAACTVNSTTVNPTAAQSALSTKPLFTLPQNPYVFDVVELKPDRLYLVSQRWVKPNSTVTVNLSCPTGMLPHTYDSAVGYYGTKQDALLHNPKVKIKKTRLNRGVSFTATAGNVPQQKLGFQTNLLCAID